MERKIQLLVITCIWALIPFQLRAQGFEIFTNASEAPLQTAISGNKPTAGKPKSEYKLYNLQFDSLQYVPPYSYFSSNQLSRAIANQDYKNWPASSNPEVEALVKNTNCGPLVHYLYTQHFLFIASVATGHIFIYHRENKSISYLKVDGMPFGLCFNPQKSELYYTGVYSRSVGIIQIETANLVDSIRLNGQSGRFLAIDENKQLLYAGVRSCRSLAKVSLQKKQLVDFVKTGNKPGPLWLDPYNNLYLIQEHKTVIAKFDATTMQLLESRQLNIWPQLIQYNPPMHQWLLKDSSNSVLAKDSLYRNHNFYQQTALDSSGRYTWIISSYTNPKWAWVKKKEFEMAGIKSYISSMHDGYYRLCAGLYPNQEVAVAEKLKFPALFEGAWLLTIHPHKF
ncbi:hypothetical protein GC194_00345 [bacterium]|nr:hypothetical protein [bacterium]